MGSRESGDAAGGKSGTLTPSASLRAGLYPSPSPPLKLRRAGSGEGFAAGAAVLLLRRGYGGQVCVLCVSVVNPPAPES